MKTTYEIEEIIKPDEGYRCRLTVRHGKAELFSVLLSGHDTAMRFIGKFFPEAECVKNIILKPEEKPSAQIQTSKVWTAGNPEYSFAFKVFLIKILENGEPVCRLSRKTEKEAIEAADHFVRVNNSHDALVKALNFALDELKSAADYCGEGPAIESSDEVFSEIEAALALAKVES